MYKYIIIQVLLLVLQAQESIICSGYVKLLTKDQNVDAIQIQLIDENSKIIESIPISSNGYYRVEVPELLNYSLKLESNDKQTISNPSQHSLKFESKSFEDARVFCQKQLNFQLKIREEAQPQAEQIVDDNQSITVPEIYRVRGDIQFIGNYTESDKRLYRIKQIEVLDAQDENMKEARILYFNHYFEVELSEDKDINIKIVVDKQKEKGEHQVKSYEFSEAINRHNMKVNSDHTVKFSIIQENISKNSNGIQQVITPLVLFGMVVVILNYDRFINRK